MSILSRFLLSILISFTITACERQAPLTIGIVVPLQHRAMDQIVAGFQETLKQKLAKPLVIKVANANNDPNLQRAIIQRMRDANYSLVVPIGVSTSQMALAMLPKQPVVSLASDLIPSKSKCQLAVVKDEIAVTKLMQFIHEIYPKLTALTLVHSSTDKILPEAEQAVVEGQKLGIQVKRKMISSLPEMTGIVQALPRATQAILVLKDGLVVSGIATLASQAASRHIPLITSDQGSVQDGAGLALGVHEKQIGVAGAELAAKILTGTASCKLPVVEMTHLTVFVNPSALVKSGQSLASIQATAKRLGYPVEQLSIR